MLKIYTYKLPFRSTFKVAGRNYDHRQGLILEYSEAGLTAYGEIAPLPGFSKESLDQILSILNIQRDILSDALLNGNIEEVIMILDQIHGFPSLSFGLDMLWHDLRAKRRGISISALLADSDPSEVRVNFTVGLADKESILKITEHKLGKGYDTIKLKVDQNKDRIIDIVSALRNRYPELKIRLDANESWSEDQAVEILNGLEKYEIEYCEQPVSAVIPKILKRISNKVRVPIAADESLRNINDAEVLSVQQSVQYFIIKPMLFGRINDIIVTKKLAEAHNISIVFTTALESIFGRTVIAGLASVLGNQNIAHGLDTGSIFSSDLADHTEILDGRYALTGNSGISLTPDTSLLDEI